MGSQALCGTGEHGPHKGEGGSWRERAHLPGDVLGKAVGRQAGAAQRVLYLLHLAPVLRHHLGHQHHARHLGPRQLVEGQAQRRGAVVLAGGGEVEGEGGEFGRETTA